LYFESGPYGVRPPATEQMIKRMTDLPSLPAVIAQVLEIVEGGEPSADELAAAIEADRAFTAKVLRIANSAFYGLSHEISTVREAIIIIGFGAVRSIAIAAAVVSGVWVEDDLFDARKFWTHGLRCGLFADALASMLPTVKPEIAFTLGVLHDIGQVIILQTIPDNYHDVMTTLQQHRKYLWQVERDVLGFDHGEIGGRASRKWRLPPVYCEAIEYHHEPAAAPAESRLAQMLALADSLSHHAGISGPPERTVQPVYRGLWEPLGLSEAAVRQVLERAAAIDVRTRSFYEQAVN